LLIVTKERYTADCINESFPNFLVNHTGPNNSFDKWMKIYIGGRRFDGSKVGEKVSEISFFITINVFLRNMSKIGPPLLS